MTRKYVKLNVHPETRHLAKVQATKEGDNLSDWIDKLVRRAAKKDEKELEKRRDHDWGFF